MHAIDRRLEPWIRSLFCAAGKHCSFIATSACSLFIRIASVEAVLRLSAYAKWLSKWRAHIIVKFAKTTASTNMGLRTKLWGSRVFRFLSFMQEIKSSQPCRFVRCCHQTTANMHRYRIYGRRLSSGLHKKPPAQLPSIPSWHVAWYLPPGVCSFCLINLLTRSSFTFILHHTEPVG